MKVKCNFLSDLKYAIQLIREGKLLSSPSYLTADNHITVTRFWIGWVGEVSKSSILLFEVNNKIVLMGRECSQSSINICSPIERSVCNW